MGRVTRIEESGTIPEDAVVRHYDELDDDVRHCLPSLVERAPYDEAPVSSGDNADELYVKFTDYYRIQMG
ncbi:hypothetical protein [Halorussus sp. AFM4]|uniref:hypothetical protein n=1 Tax=Halorussus sp. AFM4 TaxID=3421651 RepID=UPI003EB9F5AA